MKRFLRGISRPGGRTVEIEILSPKIKLKLSDFFDRNDDGVAWAPLTSNLPTGTVVTVLGAVCTVAFDDSSVGSVSAQVIDGNNEISLAGNFTIDEVSEETAGLVQGYTPQSPYIVRQAQKLWFFIDPFSFDGTQGEIEVYLRIDLP